MGTQQGPDTAARLRDAVRAEVSACGLAGTTLTSIAERAGVSRMTVYRRVGSVERLVLDALTEDVETFELPQMPSPLTAATIGNTVVAVLRQLVRAPLFRAVVKDSPTALMPYAVERFGGVQNLLSDRLERLIEQGQRDGAVRAGDPALLADTLLVALQGFALMRAPSEGLLDEARHLTIGYLRQETP